MSTEATGQATTTPDPTTKPIVLTRWQRLALIAAGGCAVFLATATFDIWPLAWIAFVPIFIAVRDRTPKHAFLWAWLAGTITNVGGFYWIPGLLLRFGHLNLALGWGLFILLAAYQGLHFGLLAWAMQRTRGRYVLPMTLLAPVFMVAGELLMPFVFKWYLAITQAWIVPVIQVADLTGPLGVTALIMLANGAIYDALEPRLDGHPFALGTLRWRPLAIAAGIILAALIYGQVRISQVEAARAAAEKIKIGVVQANIGIVQKGRARLAMKHHLIHLRESKKLQEAGADLLVWSESSYPWAIARERTRDFDDRDRRKVMRGLKVPLIFGAITYAKNERAPYNTAFMMDPSGEIKGHFDKNKLLIFGEYIPFYETFPKFRKWFPAASHFTAGTTVTTFPFRGKRIAPLICYEDLMPHFTRRLAKLRPNLLVNITNDAWFGATSEPYEHMALAVFRAVELRLDLVRAVNTGVTSVIDATGRVLSQTGAHDPVVEPGVAPERLLETAALLPGAKTVYTEIGDVFGYLMLAGSVFLLFLLPLLKPPSPVALAAAVGAAADARPADPKPSHGRTSDGRAPSSGAGGRSRGGRSKKRKKKR